MIQTRNMKRNNTTMTDIQERHFHIKNYENIKKLKTPSSWTTLVARDAKQNINYIFNSYKRETDFGPWFYVRRSYRFRTHTICYPPRGEEATNRDSVALIVFRYEIKRDKIKQEIRRDCISCSDAW